MITTEKILSKHSVNYGMIKDNPRAIVKATEALEAMIEFAREAIKADRINLLEHVKPTYNSYFYDRYKEKCTFVCDIIIDEKSLLNAPNIELL